MEKTESATVKNSVPPLKDPGPMHSIDTSDKDKPEMKKEEQKDKEESAEKGKIPAPTEEAETIKSSMAVGRKKLELGGTSYYVVSLDEIDRYIELKDTYKTDAMSAFIVYLHKDFISDLKRIRKRHSIKNRLFLVLGIFALIAIVLIALAVLGK